MTNQICIILLNSSDTWHRLFHTAREAAMQMSNIDYETDDVWLQFVMFLEQCCIKQTTENRKRSLRCSRILMEAIHDNNSNKHETSYLKLFVERFESPSGVPSLHFEVTERNNFLEDSPESRKNRITSEIDFLECCRSWVWVQPTKHHQDNLVCRFVPPSRVNSQQKTEL